MDINSATIDFEAKPVLYNSPCSGLVYDPDEAKAWAEYADAVQTEMCVEFDSESIRLMALACGQPDLIPDLAKANQEAREACTAAAKRIDDIRQARRARDELKGENERGTASALP